MHTFDVDLRVGDTPSYNELGNDVENVVAHPDLPYDLATECNHD